MKGRKRHLLVDTTGLVVKALVHPANVPDGVGGQRLLEAIADRAQALPRLRHLWVDTAYQGRFKDWVEQTLGWTVEVVRRPRRWRWVAPGPGAARAAAGLPGASAPLGGGTHVRLDRALAPHQQGLRIPAHHLGVRHLRHHDPRHAASARGHMRG